VLLQTPAVVRLTAPGVEMSSAEQPDIAASTRPPARLSAVPASRGQRETPGPWLRTGSQEAAPLPAAGQPGHGRAASLRRQSAWIVDDRTGRYTGLFEIICCDCGDHPYLDYEGIPPRLQQIRGPYTLEAGLAAYAEHLGLVPRLHEAPPGRSGAGEAMTRPADPDIATRPRPATRPGAVPAPRTPHDAGDRWLHTDGESVVTLPPPGQPGHGRAARLRRQPFRLVNGRAEGGYTDAFEVICPGCGDNPDLDYSEVSPWLQGLRGPRTIKEGLAVYVEHTGGWSP
jgi:hypothetical protein